MGNSSSTRTKSKSIYRGSGGGIVSSSGLSSSTSKLAARIAPTFTRQHTSVGYVAQKNPQTPPPGTRTPNRRRADRVIPAPETINQSSSACSSSRKARPRVNLYGPTNSAADSYEDADEYEYRPEEQQQQQSDNVFDRRQRTNGHDKSRNWISTSGGGWGAGDSRDDNKNRIPAAEDIIDQDQWPCQVIDTDHPVIFTENQLYVHPQDPFQQQHPAPYSHSTPKLQQRKRVVFEKVNYEKYQRSQSQRGDDEDDGGDDDDDDDAYPNDNGEAEREKVSPGGGRGPWQDVDREGHYNQKWCQDVLNWSRSAAEYQRQHQQQIKEEAAELGNNWYQPPQHSGNRMSGTEDSGVVCQFEEEDGDWVDDEEFWRQQQQQKSQGHHNSSAYDNNEDSGRGGASQNAVEDGVDSWEVLKQKVFERPEQPTMTPSRMVRDSEGRLLGRRCSCNSMCTSLCTVETWVDDEIFDNNFNEELERRVVAQGYGICRN